MFLSRNKKNNVYLCKTQFYYIKVGFKGVKIIKACFRDCKLIYHVDPIIFVATNQQQESVSEGSSFVNI